MVNLKRMWVANLECSNEIPLSRNVSCGHSSCHPSTIDVYGSTQSRTSVPMFATTGTVIVSFYGSTAFGLYSLVSRTVSSQYLGRKRQMPQDTGPYHCVAQSATNGSARMSETTFFVPNFLDNLALWNGRNTLCGFAIKIFSGSSCTRKSSWFHGTWKFGRHSFAELDIWFIQA